MPNSLLLMILSCSCTCGNKWTHSYSILLGNGYLGGTPSPDQEHKLPVQGIINESRNTNHCFRCVPLGLNIGWTKPTAQPQLRIEGPATSNREMLNAIEKRILGRTTQPAKEQTNPEDQMPSQQQVQENGS
jgi:hypothetical protein